MSVEPKILILENSADTTGAFNAILYNSIHLKFKYSYLFVIPDNSRNVKKLIDHGFKVITLPFLELSRNPKDIILYVPFLLVNAIKLSSIIKKHNVQIVHSNDLYNLVGNISKVFVRSKLIVHIRLLSTSLPAIYLKFIKIIHYKSADKLIAVSNAAAEGWKNCNVIHDPLPQYSANSYTVRNNPSFFRIAYLSNYTKGKGQDIAIRSIHYLVAKRGFSNIYLTFAGGCLNKTKNLRYKDYLKKMVYELNLSNFVEFEDRVEDVIGFYNRFDIALNLSEKESFSYTCIEPIYQGIPTICSTSGGPQEIINHGESGLLVPVNDPIAAGKAIETLSVDKKLRNKLSKRGEILIRNKLSYINTTAKLDSQYISLLS